MPRRPLGSPRSRRHERVCLCCIFIGPQGSGRRHSRRTTAKIPESSGSRFLEPSWASERRLIHVACPCFEVRTSTGSPPGEAGETSSTTSPAVLAWAGPRPLLGATPHAGKGCNPPPCARPTPCQGLCLRGPGGGAGIVINFPKCNLIRPLAVRPSLCVLLAWAPLRKALRGKGAFQSVEGCVSGDVLSYR